MQKPDATSSRGRCWTSPCAMTSGPGGSWRSTPDLQGPPGVHPGGGADHAHGGGRLPLRGDGGREPVHRLRLLPTLPTGPRRPGGRVRATGPSAGTADGPHNKRTDGDGRIARLRMGSPSRAGETGRDTRTTQQRRNTMRNWKKRFLALALSVVMTMGLLPGTAYAAVGDLLNNSPRQNERLLEQLEHFTGESYEEAYALLDSLGLLDEEGNLITDQTIDLDGEALHAGGAGGPALRPGHRPVPGGGGGRGAHLPGGPADHHRHRAGAAAHPGEILLRPGLRGGGRGQPEQPHVPAPEPGHPPDERGRPPGRRRRDSGRQQPPQLQLRPHGQHPHSGRGGGHPLRWTSPTIRAWPSWILSR